MTNEAKETRDLLIATGHIKPVEPTTGVFEQNNLEHIQDEFLNTIDLDYEEHRRQCQDPECECQEFWETQDDSTLLIGFRYNEATEEYDPDPAAEYSAIWSGTTIQVVKSQWYIRGGLCSPCFPGQVDADNENGDLLAYSIPPDVIGYTDDDLYFQEAEALRDRIFAAGSESGESPRYKHDCTVCQYLGQYDHKGRYNQGIFDLYVCIREDKPEYISILARHGHDGPQYSSMPLSLLETIPQREDTLEPLRACLAKYKEYIGK